MKKNVSLYVQLVLVVFGSCYCHHHSVQPSIYTLGKAYYQGNIYHVQEKEVYP